MLIEFPSELDCDRVGDLILTATALRAPIYRVAVRAMNLAHRLSPSGPIVVPGAVRAVINDYLSQDESERSFLERSFLSLCPPIMDLKEAINLRRERHAREMTQEELADRAGLSSRYLGSIERGAVSASVTVLGQLAKALRVNPCELIAQPQPRKSSRSS
jgi:DNA-binding XRE family transcriptional regulator